MVDPKGVTAMQPEHAAVTADRTRTHHKTQKKKEGVTVTAVLVHTTHTVDDEPMQTDGRGLSLINLHLKIQCTHSTSDHRMYMYMPSKQTKNHRITFF